MLADLLLSTQNNFQKFITWTSMRNFHNYLFLIMLGTLTPLSSMLAYADKSKQLPVSAYGHLPKFSQIELSPNGKKLAMLNNIQGSLFLTVLDLKTGNQKHILKSDNVKVTLNWHAWANDDVILFSAGYTSRQRTIKYTETRLYKYDLTSNKEMRLVVKPSANKKEISAQFQDNIISFLPEKPNKILMAIGYDKPNHPSVYEVNIKTNKRKRVRKYKSNIDDWYADQQGLVRIAYGVNDTRVLYRLYDANGKKQRDL